MRGCENRSVAILDGEKKVIMVLQWEGSVSSSSSTAQLQEAARRQRAPNAPPSSPNDLSPQASSTREYSPDELRRIGRGLQTKEKTLGSLQSKISYIEKVQATEDPGFQSGRLQVLRQEYDVELAEYQSLRSQLGESYGAAKQAAPKQYYTGGTAPAPNNATVLYSQPGSLTGGGIVTSTGTKAGSTIGYFSNKGVFFGSTPPGIYQIPGSLSGVQRGSLAVVQQGVGSSSEALGAVRGQYGGTPTNWLPRISTPLTITEQRVYNPQDFYQFDVQLNDRLREGGITRPDYFYYSGNVVDASTQLYGEKVIGRAIQRQARSEQAINEIFGRDITQSSWSPSQIVRGAFAFPAKATSGVLFGVNLLYGEAAIRIENVFRGDIRANYQRTADLFKATPATVPIIYAGLKEQVGTGFGKGEILGMFASAKIISRPQAAPFAIERATIQTTGGSRSLTSIGLRTGTKNYPLVEYVKDVNAGTITRSVGLLNPKITIVGEGASAISYAPRTFSFSTSPRMLSVGTPPKPLTYADLSIAQASPEGALAGRTFLKQFSLTTAEASRPLAAARLSELLMREPGLPVTKPFFPLELARNPQVTSKIVSGFAGREGGVFFGSVTTQQLPLGFRNVKVGDIDLVFPERNVAAIQGRLPGLVRELNLAGENVRISAKNPLVIETVGGQKFLEAKSGIDQASLGEELAAAGFYGVRFADLKAGQSPATVSFGEAYAIRAGEQLARKGAASSFVNPPLATPALPAAFQEGGIFGRVRFGDPRTLKDVAGFIQGGRGLIAIREAQNPFLRLFRVRSTTRAKQQLRIFEESFTPEQRVAINQKIVDLTGNKVFLDTSTFQASNALARQERGLALARSTGGIISLGSTASAWSLSGVAASNLVGLLPSGSPRASQQSSKSPSSSGVSRMLSSVIGSSSSARSASRSPSMSRSGSPSRSTSMSTYSFVSVSPSLSASPSPSRSTSPSRSPSVARSVSPSSFINQSIAGSTTRSLWEPERRERKKKKVKGKKDAVVEYGYQPSLLGLGYIQKSIGRAQYTGLASRGLPNTKAARAYLKGSQRFLGGFTFDQPGSTTRPRRKKRR